MNKTVSRLLRHKQKLFTMADQVVVSGGNFLVIALALNYLTAVEFGYFTYGYSVYVIASMLISALIFQPFAVMYPCISRAGDFIDRLKVLNLVLVLTVGVAGGWGLYILLPASYCFSEILLLVLFVVFQQISDFSRKISYIIHDASSALARSLMVYPLRLVLMVIFAVDSTFELYVLLIISTLINSGIELKSIIVTRVNNMGLYSVFGQLLKQSRWLLANVPLAIVWGRAPVFLLGETVGVVYAGTFMAIRNLTNIANVPLEMLETKVSATLGRYVNSNMKDYRSTILSILVAGIMVWGGGLYVLVVYSGVILEYYGGGKLVGAEQAMVILWAANFLIFLFRLQSVHMRTIKNTPWIFSGYLFGVMSLMLAYFVLSISDNIVRMSTAIVLASFVIVLVQFIGVVVSGMKMRRAVQ